MVKDNSVPPQIYSFSPKHLGQAQLSQPTRVETGGGPRAQGQSRLSQEAAQLALGLWGLSKLPWNIRELPLGREGPWGVSGSLWGVSTR